MNEVAKVDEQTSVPVVASPESQIMEAISSIACNPDADIDKMQKLMEMHQSMEDRQAEAAFNAALSVVQGQLEPVVARSHNSQTNSKYAKIEMIAKAARPILSANGFSTTFRELPSHSAGNVRIAGQLRHASGHKEDYENEIPLDDKGIKGSVNKTNVHAHGSSLTYARRYCLMGMLDISITEDDDGNAGGGRHVEMIDDEQIDEIEHLISSEEIDKAGFLKFHKMSSVSEIAKKDFDAACAQIRKAGAAKRANGDADE